MGIIVTNYPYGYGESFLKDELEILSGAFDRIYIIIPSFHLLADQKQLFELPPNAHVVPIEYSYSTAQKLFTFFRVGPFRLYAELTGALKKYNLPLSFGVFKVMHAYLTKEFVFRKELWKFLSKTGVRRDQLVLYSYWLTEYTFALFKLKKKFPEIKVFTRVHGWDLYFERHTPPYLPFREAIVPGIDGTFTVSERSRQYLLHKLQCSPVHVQTSYLGVKGFKANPFQFKQKELVILTMAFIAPVKNLELFIESLTCMSQDIRIQWYHIGDGSDADYAAHIKTLAKEKLGEKLNIAYHFTGNLSQPEIDLFIQTVSIDLLVNTSHSEGLPVSMMEALSAGIPIAGPAVGGIPEIIQTAQNGFLFTEKPTAAEIAKTLEHYSDLSWMEVQELRKQAHATWKDKFNASHNYSRFLQVLTTHSSRDYKACSKCILDNTDYPEIEFNSQGVCNICSTYDKYYKEFVLTGLPAANQLDAMISEIKTHGRHRKYDCLIGVSGGIDSTYLVYLAKKWGLRPLLLHVDCGWNSELAVHNIRKLVNDLELDLHTYVVNWEEMKDVQLAFLKASVVDIDLPADNTIVAATYKIARQFGIKFILTGHNVVTEGWLPPNFNHNKNDVYNIYDIHRKFGKVALKSIPFMGYWGLYKARKWQGIKSYTPLDYVDYNQESVKKMMEKELGWRDYGAKHAENIFTRFYQDYILPEKFKVKKKKAHLSTLINSGQLSREQALEIAGKPLYTAEELEEDKNYFIKKLHLTPQEFNAIMNQPPVPHTQFKSVINTLNRVRPMVRLLRKLGFKI